MLSFLKKWTFLSALSKLQITLYKRYSWSFKQKLKEVFEKMSFKPPLQNTWIWDLLDCYICLLYTGIHILDWSIKLWLVCSGHMTLNGQYINSHWSAWLYHLGAELGNKLRSNVTWIYTMAKYKTSCVFILMLLLHWVLINCSCCNFFLICYFYKFW